MATFDPTTLLHAARRGDRQALEALVRLVLRPAYVVALSVVRVPAEAEDLAQEGVAEAMRQLDACREPERFAGWVLAGVRNRALNRLSAAKVRQAHAATARVEEGVAGDAERVVLRQSLLAALGALTANQREVVLLHDLEGWSHGEIAQALGLSEVNSRQLLFVARKALKQQLAAQDLQEAGT